MCDSAVVDLSMEVSLRSLIGEEEAQLMREKHLEMVENWLDEASFAAELFKLHEKYEIETSDAGYAAYQKHLHEKYLHNRRHIGPVYDPLEEGCQCLFCQLTSNGTLDELNEAESMPDANSSQPKAKPKPEEKAMSESAVKAASEPQQPAEPVCHNKQPNSAIQQAHRPHPPRDKPRPPKKAGGLNRSSGSRESIAKSESNEWSAQQTLRDAETLRGKKVSRLATRVGVEKIAPVDPSPWSVQRGPPEVAASIYASIPAD